MPTRVRGRARGGTANAVVCRHVSADVRGGPGRGGRGPGIGRNLWITRMPGVEDGHSRPHGRTDAWGGARPAQAVRAS